MNKGLIHIYTGDGKGKTTAAIGLCIRVLGAGLKVIFVQFLKSENSSELNVLEKINTNLIIKRFNSQKKFIWNMNENEIEILKKETNEGYKYIKKIIENNLCDVLILDEFIWIINKNFINLKEFVELLNKKSESMEIILTGREAKEELINIADYVTEMKKIKHPFDKGIEARKGIEK
jgi:cob(I)alamin adenosyltransferase